MRICLMQKLRVHTRWHTTMSGALINIVISGASSGIGRALALEYAEPGITLGLFGRNECRLRQTAKEVEARGATARIARVDVRDRIAMREFLLDFDASAPVDALFASAGITLVTPASGEVEDLEAAASLFEVNLIGTMNMLAPIAPRMRARRAGRIALFSSLAALAPPPDSASYAASKAAILAFGLATRALYKPDGVKVSVICPGFVDTPMTGSYTSWKPLMTSPESAARRIRRGIDRGNAIVAFPNRLYWGARLQAVLPEPLRAKLLMRFRAFAQRQN